MDSYFKIYREGSGWWRQDQFGYTCEKEAGWWAAGSPELAAIGPDDELMPFAPSALQMRLRLQRLHARTAAH